MRRDQHPFIGQSVESAVRIFGEFQVRPRGILRHQQMRLIEVSPRIRQSKTAEAAVATRMIYWLAEVPEDSNSGGSKKHLCQSAESDNVPARHCCSVAMVAATMPPSAESKITTMPAGRRGILR